METLKERRLGERWRDKRWDDGKKGKKLWKEDNEKEME